MCCPNWATEKSNLDKSEAQSVSFDKLRAGSAVGVLHEVRQRHQVPREIREPSRPALPVHGSEMFPDTHLAPDTPRRAEARLQPVLFDDDPLGCF